jgi:hypothetical protein
MELKKGLSGHRPSGIQENCIGSQVHKKVEKKKKNNNNDNKN